MLFLVAWHVRLKQYYVKRPQEDSSTSVESEVNNAEKVKNESNSGSEKENGTSAKNQQKLQKKRKILNSDSDSDDLDADEDYSPTKKLSKAKPAESSTQEPAAAKPKAEKTELKTIKKTKEIKANNAEKKIKLSNGNSANDSAKSLSNASTQQNERENASKLFPRVTTPIKNASQQTTQQTVLSSPMTQQKESASAMSNLAKKIEVSTPKGGTFDVLGSIMKDMTK